VGGDNNSPIVREGPEVSMKSVASGTEVHMHLVVTDEDGDLLKYRWIQAPEQPAGEFSDTAVREPNWIAPEVTAPTSFLLKVNIQDGAGSSLVSWTTIQVLPRQ
jgi:hypothetical protein